MLYARFGRGICEKFLVPYNEKLYACELSQLDEHAMGRFFPHASLTEIVRNMREPDNSSYNQTFSYPEGGAIEYVNALASAVPSARIHTGEALLAVDLERSVARTTRRELLAAALAVERAVSALRRADWPRLRRQRLQLEQGAGVQSGLRSQRPRRRALDVLPEPRAGVLPLGFLRQHLRDRSQWSPVQPRIGLPADCPRRSARTARSRAVGPAQGRRRAAITNSWRSTRC